jgi:hypothetical protein
MFTAGGRLYGGSHTVNLFAELLYHWRQQVLPKVDPQSAQWSAGLEFKLSEKLWVSTGIGKSYNDTTTRDRSFVLTDLKWKISDQARFRN